MTEYAHNHPPTCCCPVFKAGSNAYPIDPCPLCTEHGELATLGKVNTEQAHTGERIYSCCAQLIGRPHTDYCRRDRTTLAAGQTSQSPTQHRDYTGTNADTFTELDHTMRRGNHISAHLRSLCTPDMCGKLPSGPEAVTYFGGWHYPQHRAPHAVTACTPECGPTPLATPTPGVCPSCGQDYQRTPTDCATPERHDHPR